MGGARKLYRKREEGWGCGRGILSESPNFQFKQCIDAILGILA